MARPRPSPRRPLLTKSFARKFEAEEWARSIEHKIDTGEHVPSSEARKRTVADAIDRYLTVSFPRAQRRKNASEQIRLLTWWRDEIGSKTLVNLTPSVVAEARDALAAPRAPSGKPLAGSTVDRHMAALSGVLSVAVKEYGWLARNPIGNVTKFAESKGRERFLSDPERYALLAECEASPFTPLPSIVQLALATGARKSELLSLQWNDVDLVRRTARFRRSTRH
ncbi:MAG: tyrosine-type recombinase/integrase [Rudaea sp.]|nr:tyrosine-type recombinase/integrase [Rudaea sp.]